jgi:hypothetical protein
MQRVVAVPLLPLVLLLGSLAGPAVGAPADPDLERKRDLERWSPSVALGFDVLMQSVSGEMDTSYEPRFGGDVGVRGSGDGFFANPMFGGNLELAAPSWTRLPWSPRLYGGVGFRYAQKIPHKIATSGDTPGEIPPEDQYFPFDTFRNSRTQPVMPTYINGMVNPNCDPCAPEAVPGQGIGLVAEAGHFYWQAELGVIFTIPVGDRSLLIKPALGYYQQEFTLQGTAHRVYREETGQRPFFPQELDTTETSTFQALGPKIVLEWDAARFEEMGQRFGASLFFDAGLYWLLGKRDTTAFVVEEPPYAKPPHTEPDWAEYRMIVNPMSYRLGVGVKLNWYPR